MTEQFKNHVKEYVDINNQLSEASKALSVLRKRKQLLMGNICSYMNTNEFDELKLNDCKLKTYMSKSTAPLNKDYIYSRCLVLVRGDEEKAKGMANFICDPKARPKKEKMALRKLKLNKKDKAKSNKN